MWTPSQCSCRTTATVHMCMGLNLACPCGYCYRAAASASHECRQGGLRGLGSRPPTSARCARHLPKHIKKVNQPAAWTSNHVHRNRLLHRLHRCRLVYRLQDLSSASPPPPGFVERQSQQKRKTAMIQRQRSLFGVQGRLRKQISRLRRRATTMSRGCRCEWGRLRRSAFCMLQGHRNASAPCDPLKRDGR